MAKEKVENEKICAILSYLLIGVIWYFADEKMKKSEFARYHAKQGLVLLIAAIVYSIILSIIVQIIITPLYFTGGIVSIFSLIGLFQLLGYVPLIWAVIGIINAANGNMKELPLIGKFAKKFSF
jgi:uncharacterized membrane protein